VTGAFTLEKNPAKQPLLQHEVAKTANKCSFRNALLHVRLVSRAVPVSSGTQRSGRWGALRSEIKQEAEGRGTFAEQGTPSA
jgi:hypothetical protein